MCSTTGHLQEVTYGLLNRDIFDDLEWPWSSFKYCEPYQCDFLFSLIQSSTQGSQRL